MLGRYTTGPRPVADHSRDPRMPPQAHLDRFRRLPYSWRPRRPVTRVVGGIALTVRGNTRSSGPRRRAMGGPARAPPDRHARGARTRSHRPGRDRCRDRGRRRDLAGAPALRRGRGPRLRGAADREHARPVHAPPARRDPGRARRPVDPRRRRGPDRAAARQRPVAGRDTAAAARASWTSGSQSCRRSWARSPSRCGAWSPASRPTSSATSSRRSRGSSPGSPASSRTRCSASSRPRASCSGCWWCRCGC